MSMTSALNNALTGLGAVGRSAQQVSSNIANALTPGYGMRELLQSGSATGGAQVDGVRRMVNVAVLSDRRLAEADVAQAAIGVDFLTRLQQSMGTPDDPGALTGRLTRFEGLLIEAASRPDSGARLQAVVDGAKDLVSRINMIGADIQDQRQQADAAIARDVETLNITLSQIDTLNASIARSTSPTETSAALMDQRQVLIDRIAVIVPLREIPRDRGVVALMTTGGQILLDSRPAVFEFTQANAVTPGASVAGGTLSGLSLDGQPVSTDGSSGRLQGGRLAANFDLRDTLAPQAQARLDDFARDLIQRFEAPGVDPTRAVGDSGLFTDAGAALTVNPAVGLAQRLSLNVLADPDEGGQATRLRDGLGASAPGNVGNATVLQAMSDAMTEPCTTPLGSAASSADIATDLIAHNSGSLFRAEQSQAFQQNRANSLRAQELTSGVDTDQEMQKLLWIEQAYSANARVIQAVDDMMRRLLEI